MTFLGKSVQQTVLVTIAVGFYSYIGGVHHYIGAFCMDIGQYLIISFFLRIYRQNFFIPRLLTK